MKNKQVKKMIASVTGGEWVINHYDGVPYFCRTVFDEFGPIGLYYSYGRAISIKASEVK